MRSNIFIATTILEESILQGIIWKERDILFGMIAQETERVILLEVYRHHKISQLRGYILAFFSLILLSLYILHESRIVMATHAKERKILFMGFRSVGKY